VLACQRRALCGDQPEDRARRLRKIEQLPLDYFATIPLSSNHSLFPAAMGAVPHVSQLHRDEWAATSHDLSLKTRDRGHSHEAGEMEKSSPSPMGMPGGAFTGAEGTNFVGSF